jgi:RimJ/RimL family protein N-acetyltransferase
MASTAHTRAALRNGQVVAIRPLQASDEAAVVSFFTSLPRDRTEYQRGHLCEPELAQQFVRGHSAGDRWSLLGCDEAGTVVGMVTVHSAGSGWRRHVGEIRVVVSPSLARQGIAAALVGVAAELARARGLQMLHALVLDSQPALRQAIERLGFHEEAVLQNHAMNDAGETQDLFVYVADVEALRRTMKRLLPELGVAVLVE